MTNVKFSTVPLPRREGRKVRCRAVVRHNGTIGEEAFKQRVAKRCGYDGSVVGCVMDAGGTQLGEELSMGNRVHGGWFNAYLTIQGSFDSVDEPWDSSRHRLVGTIVATGSLKSCLAGATAENVTEGPSVLIQHVADDAAQVDCTITGTTDVMVRITGTGLAVDAESEDEGVWLEDADGVVKAVAEVLDAAATTLACRFAELPAAGGYTLVVASRNGMGAAYGVAVGRRKVTVSAAAGE